MRRIIPVTGVRAVLICGVVVASLGEAIASTAQARTVWDGVYTEEQAQRGGAVYRKSCAVCHQDDLSGDQFSAPLINRDFQQRWVNQPLADLLTLTSKTMPAAAPGSLTPVEYADVVAFLLKMNKYPAGQRPLSDRPDDLTGIRITTAPPLP